MLSETFRNKLSMVDKPTITFFMIMLAYHMLANINYGDDVTYFQTVLAGSEDYVGDTIKFSIERYNTWSSRTIIEIFIIYLAHLPHIVWRIADTMVWMVLYSSMANLLDIRTEKMKWCLTLVLLLFPFKYTGTAGWICTSLNYTWPTAFGCYFFTVMQKWRTTSTVSIIPTITAFCALIYAANEEQMSAVLFLILSAVLIYDIRRAKISKLAVLSYVITICVMAYILTCPGNEARLILAEQHRIPGYMDYSVIEKLDLGFVNLVNSYFQTFNILSVVLCVTLYFSYNFDNKIKNILAGTVAWSILCQILVKIGIWSELQEIHCIEDINVFLIVQYIVPLVAIICIAVALYKISCYRHECVNLAGIFFIGLTTAMIMGFSPTVYASGPRTFVFLFTCSIYIILRLISQLNDMHRHVCCKYLFIVTSLIVIRTLYMVSYKQ